MEKMNQTKNSKLTESYIEVATQAQKTFAKFAKQISDIAKFVPTVPKINIPKPLSGIKFTLPPNYDLIHEKN